jgi:hypothetical protein
MLLERFALGGCEPVAGDQCHLISPFPRSPHSQPQPLNAIRELEREHDALERTISRKHQELDLIISQIRARTEPGQDPGQNVKVHFGV